MCKYVDLERLESRLEDVDVTSDGYIFYDDLKRVLYSIEEDNPPSNEEIFSLLEDVKSELATFDRYYEYCDELAHIEEIIDHIQCEVLR